MLDELTLSRIMDPGRGEFCAATKQGLPLPFPPVRREPVASHGVNPRGVRRPFKTEQDSQPVHLRARVIAWEKRLKAAQR